VVLDSVLRTPPDARVLAGGGETLLCHRRDVPLPPPLVASGAQFEELEGGAGGLDLTQLMALLAARQCNEILVESGPRLAGALLQAGLLDELIVYIAPALLGDQARPLLHLPLERMAQKVALEITDVRRVGRDWRFTAGPA
jgi:diaminohydroxyphosphoribosylaminopyrimidine deaminase/5-amino-6-(5-phosphoribosylamino)uracil reductase